MRLLISAVSSPLLGRFAVLLMLALTPLAQAYDGRLHQQLTFIAAKHFNRCVAGSDIPRLTPLEVRYVAKTNVAQADRNIFTRMFNWRYYDRGEQAARSFLWAVDTRFHEHFNEVLLVTGLLAGTSATLVAQDASAVPDGLTLTKLAGTFRDKDGGLLEVTTGATGLWVVASGSAMGRPASPAPL